MSRVIKFRAWDKIERVMCDVSLIRFGVGAYLVGNSPTQESFSEVDGEIFYKAGTTDGHFRDMSDIELMQFTGLHDKNGVEIYEGDVVRYKYYSSGAVISLPGAEDCQPRKVAQIKIGDLLSGIKLYGIGILEGDSMEVIGNIHDNQEPLEGKS